MLNSSIAVEFVANPVLAWAVGLLWLVGLTNAFNLLDNMDGLAGSLGVDRGRVLRPRRVTVPPNRDIFIAFASPLGPRAAGSCPFNLRLSGPALVFMGDSGSQAIGFVLASLGLIELDAKPGRRSRRWCSPC